MSLFDKVIGYEAIKTELSMICDVINDVNKYNRLGVKIPKGLILFGEPGVGKTLMAQEFMLATKRNSFVCRKKESSKNFILQLKKIFDEAKASAPSVILLDDLDKFSNSNDNLVDTEEYVAVQALIDDIKDSDVFIIATINKMEKLPPSLIRSGRFDVVLKIHNPHGRDAVDIVKHYLKTKKYVDDVDPDEIARMLNGKSCAELESLINRAGLYAGYECREKIETKDFIKAYKNIFGNSASLRRHEPGEFYKQTAYHEAGHAVVMELLEPESVTVVSIDYNPYDELGGFTAIYNSEGYYTSINLMKKRICGLLAGRCAVEMEFGIIDVGSDSDIMGAANLISRLVDDYCELGFDKYKFPFDKVSDGLNERREITKLSEMQKYYNQVKKLLAENKNFINKVANALMECKTLTGKELRRIKKDCCK